MRWLIRICIFLIVVAVIIDVINSHTVEKLVVSLAEDLWDGIRGYNCQIVYVADDGIDPPESQKFKSGTHPRIADEMPIRAGYHFTGWTSIEGSNEPLFIPGEKSASALDQTTVLYACWDKHDSAAPYKLYGSSAPVQGLFDTYPQKRVKHTYDIIESHGGNVIRVQCSCGFELMDRDISEDTFVSLGYGENKTMSSLKKKDQEKARRQYILYRTQDFAPAAIKLINAFYSSIDLERKQVDTSFSNAALFMETLQKGSKLGSDFLASKIDHEKIVDFKSMQHEHANTGETLSYVLHSMTTLPAHSPCRESAKKVFDELMKKGEMAANAVGIGRALFYSYDMLADNGSDIVDRSQSMVKALHAVVAFAPYAGDYYDKLFEALEEGLELYEQCLDQRNNLYALLDSTLDGKATVAGLRLEYVDQARNGAFAGLPTVMEVLDLLIDPKSTDYYGMLSPDEKTLVVWYLTLRLEYDFQTEFNISLKDYKEYFVK